MKVLVINCGSSSLKYQLLNPETGVLLAKRIGDLGVSPMLAILSSRHETQYSRLFRS